MNEIEKAIDILKNMAEDCDDCKYYKECNGNGICYDAQDHVFEFAIEAKKSQSERDKMRCENCNWCDIENCCMDDDILTSDITSYTCTFYGDDVPDGVPVEENHFCSRFEPKENENG